MVDEPRDVEVMDRSKRLLQVEKSDVVAADHDRMWELATHRSLHAQFIRLNGSSLSEPLYYFVCAKRAQVLGVNVF